MEKQIDKLIELHKDNKGCIKYIMPCGVEEFKDLQKLMANKYKIEDYKKDTVSMWRHIVNTDNITSVREGTVKFKGFEINVYCTPEIVGGYTISKMNVLPLAYMDIFKNSRKD